MGSCLMAATHGADTNMALEINFKAYIPESDVSFVCVH